MTTSYQLRPIPLTNVKSTGVFQYATGGFQTHGQNMRSRKELFGERNENWKKSVERHENASTNLVAYRDTIGFRRFCFAKKRKKADTIANAHMRKTLFFYGVIPCFLDPNQTTYTAASGLSAEAYSRTFVKHMSKMRSEFRALTTAGEMRQTLTMLRSPFRTLLNSLEGYHTLNYKRARKLRMRGTAQAQATWHKLAADSWLEYSWGLKPLLSDIEGYADSFLACYEPYRTVMTTKARKVTTSPYDTGSVSYDVWRVRSRGGIEAEAGHSITSCLETQPTSSFQAYHKGLSFHDILPTAWELVPFSCLFDYVIPIGSYLDAYATWSGAPILWSTKTERLLVKTRGTSVLSTDLSASGQYLPPTGVVSSTFFATSRRISRVASFDIEPVFYPSVDFIEKFSLTRGLNMASILRNLLSYR